MQKNTFETPRDSFGSPVVWIRLSLIFNIVILGIKTTAYFLTNSVALESDALETIVNVVASLFAFFAVKFGAQPADEGHPYGHGKIEHFAAAFEGGLIFLASIIILGESFRSVFRPHELGAIDFGLGLSFLCGVANFIVGKILLKKSKQIHSHALEAEALHLLSDVATTFGAGFGLLLAKLLDLPWIDGLTAGVLGVLLAWTGGKVVVSSAKALLDAEDPKILDDLVLAMNEERPAELVAVHELRTLRSGAYLHVDVHLVVPEYMTVEKSHSILDEFEGKVFKRMKRHGEFHSHVDPCLKRYCVKCSVLQCPIRTSPGPTVFEIISVKEATQLGPPGQ